MKMLRILVLLVILSIPTLLAIFLKKCLNADPDLWVLIVVLNVFCPVYALMCWAEHKDKQRLGLE